ncbi:hypothetical protein R3P38DRAFT_3184858 [Favolaschia claudopus]|uniref:Uncharacterized protein n=1 Tax=Favolaschia claudopus TaxID=2862362 RepID=A0AAW0C658_9AGAR
MATTSGSKRRPGNNRLNAASKKRKAVEPPETVPADSDLDAPSLRTSTSTDYADHAKRVKLAQEDEDEQPEHNYEEPESDATLESEPPFEPVHSSPGSSSASESALHTLNPPRHASSPPPSPPAAVFTHLDPSLRPSKTPARPLKPMSSHLIPPGYNSSSSSSSGPSSLRPIKPFSTLKAPAKQLASSQSSQQAQLDALTSRLQKSEVNAAFSKQCLDELPELYDRVEDMSLKIEDLESALLSVSSGQILSDKDQQTVLPTYIHFFLIKPSRRLRSLQSMLRAVMYSLMGISDQDTNVLREPVFKGNKISVYWIATDIPDELALYPSCPQDVINGLSDKNILQRGSRTTFKHLKEKYQRQGKSASEKKIDNQLKRHSRRRNEVRFPFSSSVSD